MYWCAYLFIFMQKLIQSNLHPWLQHIAFSIKSVFTMNPEFQYFIELYRTNGTLRRYLFRHRTHALGNLIMHYFPNEPLSSSWSNFDSSWPERAKIKQHNKSGQRQYNMHPISVPLFRYDHNCIIRPTSLFTRSDPGQKNGRTARELRRTSKTTISPRGIICYNLVHLSKH